MRKNFPLVGISACFFHPDKTRPIFKEKRLIYLEQSMSDWLMKAHAYPILIPPGHDTIVLDDYVQMVDGMLFQGGSDIAPESYREKPLKPEWNGDSYRDRYEIELFRLCLKYNKPVLGICRGMQLINVALGGSMFQDIQTQVPNSIIHRNWDIYDENYHDIIIDEDSYLYQLYNTKIGTVNSVHHQAVNKLGNGLKVLARSKADGIVEAVQYLAEPEKYVLGVQWHPEYALDESHLLNSMIIMNDFIHEIERRR